MEWQPIESVPTDGSAVLVWLESPMLYSRVHSATFHQNIAIIGGVFKWDAPTPTHWMPLPEPPNDATNRMAATPKQQESMSDE